mgnify:CR=1 FL=1
MSVPVTNKTIIIDAGHGEPDGGAVSHDGIKESTLNLQIALKLEDALLSEGIDVVMTREDEDNIASPEKQSSLREMKVSDIDNRIAITNQSNADALISIHMNQFSASKYHGWQTFYQKGSAESKLLAENIQNEITKSIGTENSRTALKIENIKLIDNAKIPAVIVECGFLSNEEEEKSAYQNNEITGYIIKEDNTYTIYADESQNSGEIAFSLSNAYLESYNQLLGNQYLLENNINPEYVYSSIQIKTESLTKEDTNMMTNLIYSLIITYITMIVVMVGVVVVTDATSGEKERGTLETILTFPIRSTELVMGKYLATTILGFIVGLISYLLSIPTFLIGKEMFKSYEEIVFTTNASSILLAIFVIFLVALLASGVCMVLAGKAKTYKEAQSSLQFVSLLPMIPYFLRVMEIDSSIFNLIPIANCGALLNDIVMNNIDYKVLSIVIITTIIYTVAILFYISKQYKSEKTLFS